MPVLSWLIISTHICLQGYCITIDSNIFIFKQYYNFIITLVIYATIEWQWDGGHVPSEVLGASLSLYVDQMYAKYVDGAVTDITKAEAETQTENGDSQEASGTDLSSWVSYENGTATFTLADALSYRTNGASKAMPGFDVIDYGQEDYVFGNSEVDARHWDKFVLEVLKEHEDVLSELFNQG